MIRKGIRPVMGLVFDYPEESLEFRKVIPFRRSWKAIAIVAAFDLAFLVPAIMTFQQTATQWGSFDDLFDLVTALFLSAWLLGWSIAPILLTAVLALLLFGREVIKIHVGELVQIIGLPLVGVAGRFQIDAMRNLRLENPPKLSGKSWRGPHLTFDYGVNSFSLGSDMDEAKKAEFESTVIKLAGRAIRTGEATPEEQRGAWRKPKPDVSTTRRDIRLDPVNHSSPTALVLIAANLVPIIGALFWNWKLSDVMVLYWAESAIIGIYNIARMAVIAGWLALPAGLFFLGHFGAFMAVHFLFIYGIFVQGVQDTSGGDLREVGALFLALWPALAALLFSHGFSFWQNFIGRREFENRSLSHQMAEPYGRIVFMHVVLIIGGGVTLVLGNPMPVLVLVIALKIAFDLRAHLRQRASL